MFADLREREIERDATLAALARAIAGAGAVLAFEAPAGGGKTALLRAAGAHARRRKVTVLTARGVELEQGLTAGVVGQLFVPSLRSAADGERAALLEGPAALAGPALGLSPPAEAGDPVGAALHGLYWLCVNLTDRGPLVLAVDDAHWADEASLRFLAHLVPRLGGLPLLLLIAARPAEPGAERGVLDCLLHDESVEVHRPRPLSRAATATVVRERAGAASSDDLCHACHLASGGNPFLLNELLGALIADHADPSRADARLVERLGPRSVARSVLVRLARLPSDAVAIAHAVAIFPEGAQFRRVIALAQIDEVAAARAIDRLAEVAILAPGRPLTFLHPVMRTAVYEELPAARRALMHLGAARLLRDEGATATEVATHLLASEPGSDPEAFADLMSAAAAAVAAGAPAAAVQLLDRALQEPAGGPAVVAALHLRGVARMLCGDGAAEHDLRAAAQRAPPGMARAAALHDLARFLGFALESTEAVGHLDEAILECGDDDADLARQCRLDRTWIAFGHDELAGRFVAEMQDLRAPAEPAGLFERSTCTVRAHWLAWSCEDAEQVVQLANCGLRDEALSSGLDGLPAVAYGSVALNLADRPGDALAAVERALEAMRGTGAVRTVGLLHLLAAGARIYAGDLPDAAGDLEFATRHAGEDPGTGMVGAYVLASQAVVALERSGPAAAESVLGSIRVTPTVGGMALHAAHGRIHLAAGRHQEAFADLQAAVDAAHLRGLLNPFYLFPWGCYLALAAAAAGDRELALALAEEDLRLARRFGAPGVLGSALRVAGLVRRGDDGLELLAQATTVLARSNARLVQAQALADLGSALRRANRRAAAREPLHHAIDLALRCGATRLANDAKEELRATGGRLRREYVTGIEALTPSELRVARMAAAGLTNRNIAQQLFLTVSTVEMHVGGALFKLGISSRRELAGVLDCARERV